MHVVGEMYEQMVRQNSDTLMMTNEHGTASISKNALVQMVKNKVNDKGALYIITCLASMESIHRGAIDSALFMILSEPSLYAKIKQETVMIDSMIDLSPRFNTEFQQMRQNIPQDLMIFNSRHATFQNNNSTHLIADDEKVNSASSTNEIRHEEELNRNNSRENEDNYTNCCPCQIL